MGYISKVLLVIFTTLVSFVYAIDTKDTLAMSFSMTLLAYGIYLLFNPPDK